MVNIEKFIERLKAVMNYNGLSASAFADKIEVQRSSISHILTGRNKPSLEFVLKIIKTFPEVNLYWLLNGKGSFPTKPMEAAPPAPGLSPVTQNPVKKVVKKIIVLYSDESFDVYQGEV